MPWCPNCKNEYKEGYKVCADCGADLVDELTKEEYEDIKAARDLLEIPDDETLDLLSEIDEENNMVIEKEPSVDTYIKAYDRAENYKASAYSLLLVGIVGLVFMVLVMTGIVPINIAANVKVISYIVMTGMFLAFIIIGFKSFKDAKKYYAMSAEEDSKTEELTNWFIENYSAESIDKDIFWTVDADRSVEYDYFKRYEYIKQAINEKAPDIDKAFAEKLIEDLYSKLYEC